MTQNAFYIEGYAGQISYVAGQELTLHVSATASQFRLRCERVGKTRVEVLCVEDIPCQHHPVPDNASSHGCDWPSAFSVPIPEEWSSGYYEFTIEIADDGGTYEQRCAAPRRRRAILCCALGLISLGQKCSWGCRPIRMPPTITGAVSVSMPITVAVACRGIASRSNALIAGYFPAGRRPLCSG